LGDELEDEFAVELAADLADKAAMRRRLVAPAKAGAQGHPVTTHRHTSGRRTATTPGFRLRGRDQSQLRRAAQRASSMECRLRGTGMAAGNGHQQRARRVRFAAASAPAFADATAQVPRSHAQRSTRPYRRASRASSPC
jgi:hypothetical protein